MFSDFRVLTKRKTKFNNAHTRILRGGRPPIIYVCGLGGNHDASTNAEAMVRNEMARICSAALLLLQACRRCLLRPSRVVGPDRETVFLQVIYL